MGLFDNIKENQNKARAKQEAKSQDKINKFLRKKGLEDLSSTTNKAVQNVMYDQAGLGFLKAGMALSFAKAEEQAKVNYLSSLTEQNWIIIKQNDELMKQNNEIIAELKKLTNSF